MDWQAKKTEVLQRLREAQQQKQEWAIAEQRAIGQLELIDAVLLQAEQPAPLRNGHDASP